MKIRSFISIFIFLLSVLAFSQKFTILHTNDMHSRLMGFSPSSEYSPETTGEKPLILDGGDFLMGTLFHTMKTSEGQFVGRLDLEWKNQNLSIVNVRKLEF